jgi:hypothetical protein
MPTALWRYVFGSYVAKMETKSFSEKLVPPKKITYRLVICKNILSRKVTLPVFAFLYEDEHPRLNSCNEIGEGEEPIVRCDTF